MKSLRYLLATVALCVASAFQAAAGNVESGDSAYNAKNYSLALDYYSRALGTQGASSNLYYNLGNTHYRLGNTGQAVLFYERALGADPSNADAAENLAFVRGKIANAPEDDSSFLANLHHAIIAKFAPDTWAWVAFGIFFCAMLCVALYLFTGNVSLRKAGFFGGIILLGIFVYALVVAITSAKAADSHEYGVVTVPTSNLRSNPSGTNSRTEKVIPVPEGTKVLIIDSLPTPDDPATRLWYEVKLNNTTRAWASGADIERI